MYPGPYSCMAMLKIHIMDRGLSVSDHAKNLSIPKTQKILARTLKNTWKIFAKVLIFCMIMPRYLLRSDGILDNNWNLSDLGTRLRSKAEPAMRLIHGQGQQVPNNNPGSDYKIQVFNKSQVLIIECFKTKLFTFKQFFWFYWVFFKNPVFLYRFQNS